MFAFNFEKNLSHQDIAVRNTLEVFDNLTISLAKGPYSNRLNPIINEIVQEDNKITNNIYPYNKYFNNIMRIHDEENIKEDIKPESNIIDIMMETGTGKTYTYTKTIYELNKKYGIFKFIIVVPTLSIKEGTIDFLESDSSREHFKEQYGKLIKLHKVESQKKTKSKKVNLPHSIISFVESDNSDKYNIQVMIINAGMINSDTLQKHYDKTLHDQHNIPLEAIAATRPFMIIDEPHKFMQSNKTWENLIKIRPQFIIRYGATFPEKEIKVKNELKQTVKVKVKDYHNLIYKLTAVDSFNKNLVKGVIGHITEFEAGKNALVKLISSDTTEARFELIENNNKTTFSLKKNESLQIIHPKITDLTITELNKTTVELSNGLELKKGHKINPYSYEETLQEIMIQKAIQNHFDLERSLLTRESRIKPLTLFFIDNIEEYKKTDGYIRRIVEDYSKAEITKRLEKEDDVYYKSYLEKSLIDLSSLHAGYFSIDNSIKDESIEKGIKEILVDKKAILDLENPRRFVFSKWTLREGWDNPNVFQICKLRSSGSETSKLQEVGRGLRLPVNEYGNRVKDEQFYLNYYVDFTESDFVDKLVNEINKNSGVLSFETQPEKLSDEMINVICDKYQMKTDELLTYLDENNVVTRSNQFKENGFDFIKQHYPLIFQGINSDKVRNHDAPKKKITIRTEKYSELKELWEKLNEKVILEYSMANEGNFKQLLIDFFKDEYTKFSEYMIYEKLAKVAIVEKQAIVRESESIYSRNASTIQTITYSTFLKELSKRINININTIHTALKESEKDINPYLSQKTIRIIEDRFNFYLMKNAIDKFTISYKQVTNKIHPTKLTDENGNVLKEISATDVGVMFSKDDVASNYFYDELFYDSELERKNIIQEISDVIVFTKIPKNSIMIPVAGGKTYSPDFAYVIKYKNGEEKLYFIIETKNVTDDEGLREEEKLKIKYAERFFEGKVKFRFKKQFSKDNISTLIKSIMKTENI